MKKLLFFSLLVLCMPLLMTAQICVPVDTILLYHQDFEGAFPDSSITRARDYQRYDWEPSTLYPTPLSNHCLHAWTATISADACFYTGHRNGSSNDYPHLEPWRNQGYNYLYLEFSHICHVVSTDEAGILIRAVKANGVVTEQKIYFSHTSFGYKGAATSILQGDFSVNSYSQWGGTTPNASWWRKERILLSEFPVVTNIINDPTNVGFQILFRHLAGGPTSTTKTGWFIDDVSIIASKTELEPPDVTLVAPQYIASNINSRNNIGPYTIKAELKDYSDIIIDTMVCYPMPGETHPNDPVHYPDFFCIDSLQFFYTRHGYDSLYFEGNSIFINDTITSNTWITNPTYAKLQNKVNAQWTIPKACYGDTITYTIRVEDRHGNRRDSSVTFIPWANPAQHPHSNDAELVSIDSMPHAFISDSAYHIMVTFKNKSDSRMDSVDFQYILDYGSDENGDPLFPPDTGTYRWRGHLCRDWDTTIVIGDIIAKKGPDTVCVKIINRNGSLDNDTNNNRLCFYGYACDSVLSGDYTVGGPNSDYPTLEAARLALERCGIKDSVRMLLYPGTYSAQKFSGYYYGQADTANITFMKNPAYPGNVVFVDDATFGATILLDTTGYFVFKDLVIQGKTSGTYSRGFYISGGPSNDISILNCQIGVSSGTTATNYAGIIRNSAVTTTVHNITVDEDFIFSGNSIFGGNYGIYYVGSTNRRNKPISIDKNTISSLSDGIYLTYVNGMSSVDSNTITVSNSNANGMQLQYVAVSFISRNNINATIGISLNASTSITSLEYNVINASRGIISTGSGISVTSILYNNITASIDAINLSSMACSTINANKIYTTGKGISLNAITNSNANILISNNEIIANIDNATNYGAHLQSSNNLKFINNSIRIHSTENLSDSRALNVQSGNNVEVKNNILYNTSFSQNETNYPVYIQTAGTGLQLAYNNYYSTGGKIGFSTIARNNMNEWIYAYPADTNSNAIALSFPYNYPVISLKTDTCTGLEAPVYTGVTHDILGFSRGNSTTWMGAYHYSKNLDIAIAKLLSPKIGLECPSDTMPIVVLLRNTGDTPIDFATTNVTLTATIIIPGDTTISDTTASDTITYTQILTTGTLAPLASINDTIIAKANFPLNDTMSIYIVATLSGDMCAANDSLNLNDFILKFIKPFFEECFYNVDQCSPTDLNPEWTFQQVAGNGNWIVQDGAGTLPTISPVYGTGRLFFNSRGFATNTESRAIMPLIKLGGSTNPVLEFWMAHDNAGSGTANPGTNWEGITVEISTNNGQSWTALTPEGQSNVYISRYVNTSTPVWTKHRINLTPYLSNDCILIGFRAKGRATTGNNINLDRVVLKDRKANDLAIENIYTLGENPVANLMNQSVKVRLVNEGTATQNGTIVTLNVSGANTYTQTVTLGSLAPDAVQTITLPGEYLTNPGLNTVMVSLPADDYTANDTMIWQMTGNWSPNVLTSGQPDTTYIVSYSNDATCIRAIGGNTTMKLVNRFVPDSGVTIEAIRFYPVNAANAVGKKVRGFISDGSGATIATTDIYTLSGADIDNWVELPLINYALTGTDQPFYAGIEMIDPGYYIGTQIEAPIRDGAYYYMNGTTYTPLVYGRTMIGAMVHKLIPIDIAILSLDHPKTACDMANEPVTFSFTQNGTETLIPNTATFNYAITNYLGITTTVSESYPYTITPHQLNQYTFSTYDFTNNSDTDRTYQITIWVNNLPGDIVFFNDTLRLTITSRGKAAKPVVVSPYTGSFYHPATLSATEPAGYLPGDGVFSWYTMADTNTAGDTLWHLEGRGNPFTTFTLFYDTTFYVTFTPGTLEYDTVGTGTGSTTEPMKFTYGYSRGRILYPQSAIGNYGQITEIALDVATAGSGTNGIPIKIYIKQVPYDVFPNTNNNWAAEIADATLVYEGAEPFTTTGWHSFPINAFNYTEGSLLILTETNCGGTNCQTVYGSSNYPKFRSSTAALTVHSVGTNNAPPTNNFTASGSRWNMRFQFADLECQSLKVKLNVIIPDRPDYDILTEDTLFHPVPNSFPGYCTMGEDSVIVKIRNMMPDTIPANMVVIKAAITGYKVINSGNVNSTVVIRPTTTLIDTITSITGLEVITHRFSQLYDFSAPETDLQSIRYDIVVSTDLIDEIAYRDNDTLRVSVFSKQTDSVHNISVEADEYYTLNYTAAPNNLLFGSHNMFYFYANEASTAMLNGSGGVSYLTPPLFDTVVYWVAARNAITTPPPICTTKRFEFHINVQVPKYDLKTTRISYPSSSNNNLCALDWGSLKPKVWVKNTVSDSIIPANTFKLVAKYVSGATTITGSHVIATAINPGDSVEVEFGTPLNLGSTTENRVFNYKFFTEPVTPMYAYPYNDTISGTQYVPALPATPPAITTTVPYGQPYTVTPSYSPQNMFTFYDVATGGEPLAQGLSFTTDPVYANPTTYYYSGQIRDANFTHVFTSGTVAGTNNTPLPFGQYSSSNGANTQAQAKILYTVQEYEWLKNAGRIDTIAFQVTTPSTGETPVKIYIKNANNITSLPTASATWATELSSATLVYDEATDFVPTHTTADGRKWFSIPVPGGFNYDGSGIILYTEQNCNNAIYANPTAQFRYTTLAGRMVTRTRTEIGTFGNFTASSNRWNSRFVINNACESGRGVITLNTTVKSNDLEVTELVTPTTPNVYTDNETIKVKIKNHGSAPASGFSVAYRLENATPEVETYSGAPIPSGGEVEFTFANNADLHNVYLPTDFYTYIVWTNDQFHGNDTLVTTLEVPDQCISKATDTARLDISNVTFAGINNGPGTPIFKYRLSPNNGLYTDYSSTVAPAYVVQGQSYPIRITGSFTNAAPGYTSFRAVYIDLDRNNTFDATERVYYSGSTAIPAPTLADSSSAKTLGEIVIPANASQGLTKMRVIASQSNITTPCAPYTYGETEDYAVFIEYPFSIDLAIAEVLHPVGDICADYSGFVKLKLRNYGVTPFSFSTHPVQINAQFSGASSQLYTHTVSQGSLGANEDMVVEIPNIDYSAAGTYNIKAYLTQPVGDNYQINDTSINTGVVKNANVATIPYFVDFEPHPEDLELHFDTLTTFPASWARSHTTNNFQWKINMGIHHNNNVSGPEYDNSTGFADGQYAVVRSSGSVVTTAVATLTSACIDLHHDNNDYPKILSYYEHIFGASSAKIKLYVQAGSGGYYETVDSIIGRTHDSDIQVWLNRKSVLYDFNENARLRFVATGHSGNIDPAVDDIRVIYGQPDLSLDHILSPTDTCVAKGETINPRVTVRNTGPFPVYDVTVFSQLRVGVIYLCDTVRITFPHPVFGDAFMPGDSIDIATSNSGFEVPTIGNIVEFMATVFIEKDSYPYNNIKSVQTCTYTGIEDPAYDNNGMVLGQNIPNPAGGKTVIPYILPENGKATISLLSIEGQHLYSTELNGTAGDNSYEFDAAHLASGVYIYSLQFKGITLYKKMIIQK